MALSGAPILASVPAHAGEPRLCLRRRTWSWMLVGGLAGACSRGRGHDPGSILVWRERSRHLPKGVLAPHDPPTGMSARSATRAHGHVMVRMLPRFIGGRRGRALLERSSRIASNSASLTRLSRSSLVVGAQMIFNPPA